MFKICRVFICKFQSVACTFEKEFQASYRRQQNVIKRTNTPLHSMLVGHLGAYSALRDPSVHFYNGE